MIVNDRYEMSYFSKPISNKTPKWTVTPFYVYQYLRSNEALSETRELRAIANVLRQRGSGMTEQQSAEQEQRVKEQQRIYKGSRLDYVTPSGVFRYCNDSSIVCHSKLLCIDLDDIIPVAEVNPVFYDLTPECYNMATKETDAVEQLKQRLIDDPSFNTVMVFRSPRGNGLKWWLEIDPIQYDHRIWFQGVRNYLIAQYGLSDHQVDKMCGNPSRACFLCHDPLVYLRTDLIENFCV